MCLHYHKWLTQQTDHLCDQLAAEPEVARFDLFQYFVSDSIHRLSLVVGCWLSQPLCYQLRSSVQPESFLIVPMLLTKVNNECFTLLAETLLHTEL